MKTELRVRIALCAFIATIALVWTSSAQPGPQPGPGSPGVEPQAATEKADSREREAPIWIERDPQGHIAKLRLVGLSCNDKNLALAAQIKGLRELGLKAGKPTAEGLRLLRGNTNLSSVHFACFSVMPTGLLNELAEFPQIKQLVLYGASPPSSEYASLERMTTLADLQILYVGNFADADLSRLTNLSCLQHLDLSSAALTPASVSLLYKFRALTNAVLSGSAGATYWETNWHSGTAPLQGEPERK